MTDSNYSSKMRDLWQSRSVKDYDLDVIKGWQTFEAELGFEDDYFSG